MIRRHVESSASGSGVSNRVGSNSAEASREIKYREGPSGARANSRSERYAFVVDWELRERVAA
jgi:hypothetical protein